MAWHYFRTLDVYIVILLLGLAIKFTHHFSLQIIPKRLPDHVAKEVGLFAP